MKKALSLLLVLLLLLSLCACSGNGGETENTQNSQLESDSNDSGKDTKPESSKPEDSKPEDTVPEDTEPEDTKPEDTEPENTETPTTQPPATEPPHMHSFGEWVSVTEPTCNSDGVKERVCACGEKETETVGKITHTFAAATCTAPKTCTVCGTTEGKAQGHSYVDGLCSDCGEADPTYQSLDSGKWVHYHLDGELHYEKLVFMADVVICGSESAFNIKELDGQLQQELREYEPARLIEYQSETYVMPMASFAMDFAYSVSGKQITVTDTMYGEGTLVLERTDGTHLTVKESSGDAFSDFKAGTVFVYEDNSHEHLFVEFGCTEPRRCSCGETKGEAPGHRYENGTCTLCGEADPRKSFIGNSWKALIPEKCSDTCPDGLNVLELRTFAEDPDFNHYSVIFACTTPECIDEGQDYGSFSHNGRTYYYHTFSAGQDGIVCTDNGDTVEIWDYYGEHMITLERTGDDAFTVTSSSVESWIPVGTVFVCELHS